MYIADLHIHSSYSRATSRECVPEYLDLWARRKGIALIGTGDFTHPAWRKELREKLIPAEEGLYYLKEEARLPEETAAGQGRTRFVVTGEISSIYKKNGKVRKVHNLILLPGLEQAEELSRKLEAIGNIHSDGRPILGLDSRDLLEITLDTCPDAVFIPAHIWTPHFSLFGAFSGFDTIEECFEDLTPHIHALETGLSSDPPMNWRVSALDRYHLVSNSDAHSPSKLGREANLLNTQLSYPALSRALQGGTAAGLQGTIEFFPEEGKYHLDGHRNCKSCLTPAQTEQLGGKCPVCGKKITIGVQHRVEQLADREEGYVPPNAAAYENLVPLPEVIAASTGRSPASVKVNALYQRMLQELGAEFYILRQAPLEDIGQSAGPCVQEGVRRLRAGQVERSPGYDGAYGTIQLLDPSEIEDLSGQTSLFSVQAPSKKKTPSSFRKEPAAPVKSNEQEAGQRDEEKQELLFGLNKEQKEAATSDASVLAVIAGPGTGKTKTLITRIAYLVEQCGVKPAEITAVTFTNKAAKELKDRLNSLFGGKRGIRSMTIGTFHSICLKQLSAEKEEVVLIDEYQARELAAEVLRELGIKFSPQRFLQEISCVNSGRKMECNLPECAFECYQDKKEQAGVLDFDDLLVKALGSWQDKGGKGKKKPFSYLLVDEFQDINELQYQLIRAWSEKGKSLFVIGDPDQSIYGFRGSNARCFERLQEDFPELQKVRLLKNYRSTPEILHCALPVISHNPGGERRLEAQQGAGMSVKLMTTASDLAEAIAVAKEVNRMVGGIDMLDAQSAKEKEDRETPRSFSDIALLYRTHRQAELLEKCLRKESIPYVVAGRDDALSDEKVRRALGFFRFVWDGDSPALKNAFCGDDACPADLSHSFLAAWERTDRTGTWENRLDEISSAFIDIDVMKLWIERLRSYRLRLYKEKPQKLLENWAQETGLLVGEPLERLLNMAVFYKDMPSFLNNLLLGQESDVIRSSGNSYTSDTVTLMTLHGSKGLEFPVVMLCGVKQDCIPLERPNHPTDIEEERRLFYVGMTRAKEELYLLTSAQPSSFLREIPENSLERITSVASRKSLTGRQISFFD